MKKLLPIAIAAMMSANLMAVDYLVQTGAAGDAQWADAVITATKSTLVDLTANGKTIDAWIADNAQGKEVWFAAGTYTFSAACTNKANWKLYGGFAGTETATTARQVGTNPWEMKNATIFDGNDSVQLFSGNAGGQVYDGITFQRANLATGNGSVMRLGNNGSMNACRFLNNKAAAAGAQGTVQIYNGNGTFTDCYFLNNEAGQGGAIIANCTNAYSVSITGCRFENNFVHDNSTAANSGGAVHLQTAGVYTVKNCYFTGNHVDNSKNGAAISNASSNEATVIANNVFTGSYGNHAVFLMGGKFYNNTVANNQSGVLYAPGSNTTVIANNVFFGADKSSSGKISVSNNANTTFKNNATITPVNGGDLALADNIVLETANTGTEEGKNYAFFADPDNGDYTPTVGSALINAGASLAEVTTDFAGNSRPVACTHDIGAYEAKVINAVSNVECSEASASSVQIKWDAPECAPDGVQYLITATGDYQGQPDVHTKTVSTTSATFSSAKEADKMITGVEYSYTICPVLEGYAALATYSSLEENDDDKLHFVIRQYPNNLNEAAAGLVREGQLVSNPAGLTLRLFNAAGSLLLTTEADLDLRTLPAGLYIVRTNETTLKVVL